MPKGSGAGIEPLLNSTGSKAQSPRLPQNDERYRLDSNSFVHWTRRERRETGDESVEMVAHAKAVHCFCARDDGIYYGLLVKQPSTSHIPTITLQPNLQIDSLAYSQFSEMVSLDLQTLRAVPTLPASASTTRPTIELADITCSQWERLVTSLCLCEGPTDLQTLRAVPTLPAVSEHDMSDH